MPNYQPLSILVVEPNPDHHLLVGYSCKVNKFQVNPVFATDSLSALSHLEKDTTSKNPFPKLVLLDLFLPDPERGLAFLKQVKKMYPRLPVIILSNQQTEHYIQQVYDLGANSFISKPSTLEGWERQFQVLLAYWFDVVTLAPVC
ncbi:response regulator [Spirosoma spitsbergense]|jgi:CheY-like chemotaxis protein|uniref:response regulator n=1 Tax=Spirosoma spitsbergense TaxID=431554 RepID=UPI00047713A2|nr:response regulator [Spirosoma spitsbergense]